MRGTCGMHRGFSKSYTYPGIRDCCRLPAPLTPPADLNQERFESGETSDLNQPGWTLETTRLGEIAALGPGVGEIGVGEIVAAPSHFLPTL